MCQKAESVYSVVERYDNDTFRGQIRGIVGRVAVLSEDKSAAIYPDHDGKRLVRFFGACPDVAVRQSSLCGVTVGVPARPFQHVYLNWVALRVSFHGSAGKGDLQRSSLIGG
jgi:hypothetical protein